MAELERLGHEHRARLTVDDTSEPFATRADDPLVRRLTAEAERIAGRSIDPIWMGAWTDAHSFVDLAGARAVVFGPGDLHHAHRPDERVDLREVAQAARILAAVLAPASLERLAAATGAAAA